MSAARGKRRTAARRILLRPKTIVCLALVLLAAAVIVTDGCGFPLRHAAALFHMPSLAAAEEGELRVHFVDVGQGDCILLELPDGAFVLIDGGDGSTQASAELAAFCLAAGVRKFDAVFVTHTDTDHAAGVLSALEDFGAERLYLPLFGETDPGAQSASLYGALSACAGRENIATEVAQTYTYILSSSREYLYYLTCLSPYPAAEYADANEASTVLYLEYAGRRFLFTGDISTQTEEELVQAFLDTGGAVFAQEVPAFGGTVTLSPDLTDLTVLKAAHHGSGNSTGEALLSLSTPREVVFSVGAGNTYGHPSPDCLARVYAVVPAARLYRTDELGSITFSVKADGSYTVQAQKSQTQAQAGSERAYKL